MVVWKIQGNEIGPNGNGAAHFATKREADEARNEYMSDRGNGCGNVIDPPEKLTIKNRRQLARALDAAMGHGCS